ncbi:hypothetical protein BDR26DRAFT_872105 [Obelidium mucronatum]|nr:hypothetical protein BDR26DRAFT_872105 [Obelidium mucronatum]
MPNSHHPFLQSVSLDMSHIHLPEISFDPRETHETQDPAGVSEIIYERLDRVKERERRSILRFLRRYLCCCIPGSSFEYIPLSPTASPNMSDEPEPMHLLNPARKNMVDPAGLSIIERVFFKSPPNKPQVIMSLVLDFSLPPSLESLNSGRIVDLIRIAQSKHYRLSSFVDPITLNAHLLAHTADKLPCNYRFIQKSERDPNAWMSVYMDEINSNFDTAIIVPNRMMPETGSALRRGESPLQLSQRIGTSTAPEPETFGQQLPSSTSYEKSFKIIFSFHHCLGDGLSMLAFCRTFAECCSSHYLTTPNLQLEKLGVSSDPPPLLDNIFDPWIFEVLPTAVGIGFRSLLRRGKIQFQPFTKSAVSNPAITRPTIQATRLEDEIFHSSVPNSPSPVRPSAFRQPSIQLLRQTTKQNPTTNVKFLWFPQDFTARLREKSRTHGTSIASVLVITALTATHAFLKKRSSTSTDPVPTHQGWVVTNSIRHVLPTSTLIATRGKSRDHDPVLKIFGGYAGSVTNNSLKLTSQSKIWARCRSVKRTIATCADVSLKRMKVLNYCYRHPKLWRMIESRTDLSSMSRSFSVEVANLGAWDNPLDGWVGPENMEGVLEERLRLDYFGGVVNSSFDGVRGLFTLGVITLGGNMSVAVAHDASCVTEEETELFVTVFCEVMKRMSDASENVTVGDLLYGL